MGRLHKGTSDKAVKTGRAEPPLSDKSGNKHAMARKGKGSDFSSKTK